MASKVSSKLLTVFPEIRINILSRQSARDLFLRMNTVCKNWRDLIRDNPTMKREIYRQLYQFLYSTPAPVVALDSIALQMGVTRMFRQSVHITQNVYTTRICNYKGMPQEAENPDSHHASVTCDHLNSDGEMATGLYGKVDIWKFNGEEMQCTASLPSSDGRTDVLIRVHETFNGVLITRSQNELFDQSNTLYEVWKKDENQTWQSQKTYPPVPTESVTNLHKLHSDGTLFMRTHRPDEIQIFMPEEESWKECEGAIVSKKEIVAIDLLPFRQVLTKSETHDAMVCEAEIWKEKGNVWTRVGHIPSLTAHVVTKDGLWLIGGDAKGRVTIWSTESWCWDRILYGLKGQIATVFHSGQRIVASSFIGQGNRGDVAFWECRDDFWVRNTSINASLANVSMADAYSHAFYQNGNILVQGEGGQIALCDFGASRIASLTELHEARDTKAIYRFFSLPESVKRAVYKQFVRENELVDLMADDRAFNLAIAPATNQFKAPPGLLQQKYPNRPRHIPEEQHFYNLLFKSLESYLNSVAVSPEEIVMELLMASPQDQSTRLFYISRIKDESTFSSVLTILSQMKEKLQKELKPSASGPATAASVDQMKEKLQKELKPSATAASAPTSESNPTLQKIITLEEALHKLAAEAVTDSKNDE